MQLAAGAAQSQETFCFVLCQTQQGLPRNGVHGRLLSKKLTETFNPVKDQTNQPTKKKTFPQVKHLVRIGEEKISTL